MLTCLFMFTVSKQDKCLTQKINRSILPDNFWYNFSYRGISQTSTPYATETQTQLVLYADKLFMHKIHRGIDYWWSESFPSLQFKLITRLFRFNKKKSMDLCPEGYGIKYSWSKPYRNFFANHFHFTNYFNFFLGFKCCF